MLLNRLVNASNWPALQHGDFIIYSSQSSLFDKLKRQTTIYQFWRATYTSFAILVVNIKNQQLVAVRDHFGVEPFYYSCDRGQFIFASTMPDLLNCLPQRPFWNPGLPVENLFTRVFEREEAYTDETYYQSIYRVTPGHELHLNFTATGVEIQKINFWDLQSFTPESIYYKDDRDYLVHFSELLNEGIRAHSNSEPMAIEFSGGLDSSALVLASLQLNLNPGIVMNIGNEPKHSSEDKFAQKIIQHYGLSAVDAVDAQEFDLKSSMERYAEYFAGPAPYLDPILNDVLYGTVAKRGYKVLLSGVGGDECVSGHVPLRTCAWSLVKTQGIAAFLASLPPKPWRWLRAIKALALAEGHWAEHEYNLLQGIHAHHLRMRVEYKSIAAKYWGFRYVFPLLYPKLVEFCYQLPLSSKRQGPLSRWLMRQYLEQRLSIGWLSHHYKTGGIAPAVYAQIKQQHAAGALNYLFENLPFALQRTEAMTKYKLARQQSYFIDIPAYMYKQAEQKPLPARLKN